MDTIHLDNISKKYENKQALAPLSLEIQPHSFLCIVGRSGCGKTTLLRILAGLEEPSDGAVTWPRQEKVGLMFQDARLLPWLNVEQNITFAARHDTDLLATQKDRLDELLLQLGLQDAAKLYPSQLSGGMAQRVALGRTLFYNPDVLLMDEPFSALDYFTRSGLQATVSELQTKTHKTVIFVTHDVEEALLLGDRILVMTDGSLKADIPIELPRPRSATMTGLQDLRQMILELL